MGSGTTRRLSDNILLSASQPISPRAVKHGVAQASVWYLQARRPLFAFRVVLRGHPSYIRVAFAGCERARPECLAMVRGFVQHLHGNGVHVIHCPPRLRPAFFLIFLPLACNLLFYLY